MGKVLRLRFVAIIAAYALALQGLLSAFAPLQAAAAPSPLASIICSGSGGEGGADQPAGHDPTPWCPASCPMPGCAAGFILAGPIAHRLPLQSTALLQPSVPASALDRAAIRNPQVPRAPPRV